MKGPDITGSPMKERVKETKKSTAMTDRKIVELSVTDTIRAKVIEKEGLLRTLMKEEDIDREEMSLAEDPKETSPGTFLGIDIDTEDSLREAAAQRVEGEATRMMKIGRPAMVKGGSERVAQSP